MKRTSSSRSLEEMRVNLGPLNFVRDGLRIIRKSKVARVQLTQIKLERSESSIILTRCQTWKVMRMFRVKIIRGI